MTTECSDFKNEISLNSTNFTQWDMNTSMPFVHMNATSKLNWNDSSKNFSFAALNNETENDYPESHCRIEQTYIRNNPYYYSIYIIGLNLVFNGLIPFASIIILNALLYKQLKVIISGEDCIFQSLPAATVQITLNIGQHLNKGDYIGNNVHNNNKRTRMKSHEMILARVSILIVIVFIICHSVRWIPNMYELIERINLKKDQKEIKWPSWIQTITQISHFLTVLNSSVNFYIYWTKMICSKNRQEELEMDRIGRAQNTNCDIIPDLTEV